MLLKIGSLTILPGLALAPMAGITSSAFRLLVKEQGCRLLFSEMISAKGLLNNSGRTYNLLYFTPEEKPIGFQLFGSDPRVMARAAHKAEETGADFIDLNFGCPAPKITRNGEGGALMLRPQLCSSIFRAVVSAVDCPVTVKLRKGWDDNAVNVLDIARRAEESGIRAVTVHGRTVKQGYSGRADWGSIKEVKGILSIPVIGNGDIDSPQSAEAMVQFCGCDGIMIGRAARGNPWIFASVLARLENRPPPEPPGPDQKVDMILRHFSLLGELKGEAAAAREMRKHACWYIRGLPGAAAVRQQLISITGYAQAESILRQFACHRQP